MIEILGNINDAVGKHFERIKAEEEREKAEREAKWAKEREEREKREKEWKEKYPMLNAYTCCSYYNQGYYGEWQGGPCKIYFYEWSDITRQPLVFEKYFPFYKFLDESGLRIDNVLNGRIRSLSEVHISCVKDSKRIVIGSSYKILCDAKEEAEKLDMVVSVSPEV